MKQTATLLRELGLALTVGSVLTYAVMNRVVGSSTDARLIYHQRLFVSALSRSLTIPGVWMLAASEGLAASAGRRRLSSWRVARLGANAALVVNTTLVIAPLERRVTAIATPSGGQHSLPASYAFLKTREDRYGALNALTLVVMVVAGLFE